MTLDEFIELQKRFQRGEELKTGVAGSLSSEHFFGWFTISSKML
jgi:hypothetical protein